MSSVRSLACASRLLSFCTDIHTETMLSEHGRSEHGYGMQAMTSARSMPTDGYGECTSATSVTLGM